jgi:hypothetical protein
MAVTPVTPQPGLVSEVATGGDAVTVVSSGPNGGFITNPNNATDQGLASYEDLFVSPVNAAGVAGNGTTFRLGAGQTWNIIPGQTTVTSVNAVTSGHKFSITWW